ncbi:hypothetical protein [Megamonas hypermegale]|uniref:hypothetical protein n=1 Tax=Megamonas hypermegale TaxID=158847 RepID=UPI0025A4B8B3|nr:hypothetical protein [Megamonas hypermegale]MDM8143789.1 hypothetical protein [Megamonas hypermegale]
MLRKSLILSCMLFVMLVNICLAQEQARPLRVAVMPIVTDISGYKNVKAQLYSSLQEQMHVPLNDTMQTVEYIDTETVYIAMQNSNFTNEQNLDYCEPHNRDFNHELGEQNSQRI